MRTLFAILLSGWSLLGFGTAAMAHGPDAIVTVTPIPPTATLSRANVPTYAGYSIKVKNQSDDKLKILKITGTTTVLPAGSGVATFFQSIGTGVTCSPTSVDLTAVECNSSTLLHPYQFIEFVVLFKTPTAGASVTFATKTVYAEYEHYPPYYSDVETIYKSATTSLAAPNPNSIASYVPTGGGTLFTGDTGSATKTDKFVTSVTVPTSAQATTADILEALNPASCAADLLACNFSTLTIPGTFNNLTITLRRDVSTIKHGAKIVNAKIFYAANNVSFLEIFNCTLTGGPFPGQPCIAARKEYKKIYLPVHYQPFVDWLTYASRVWPPTPADAGDWEFVILATENGRYSW